MLGPSSTSVCRHTDRRRDIVSRRWWRVPGRNTAGEGLIGGLILGANQSIKGSGTVVGPVTADSGSPIYPGADPAVGKLTFNSGLNMAIGAIATFDLSTSGTGANDQVVINGNQSVLSFANNTIHIKAPSTSATLDTAIPYALFQNNSASNLGGLPNVTPVFDVAPANHEFRVLAYPAQRQQYRPEELRRRSAQRHGQYYCRRHQRH